MHRLPFVRNSSFRDRKDAGLRLAAELAPLRGGDLLVLGIPRGGVPVADAVATALDAELDVIVARKIGAPEQPELALGAITADGSWFLNESALAEFAIQPAELRELAALRMTEARARLEALRGSRPPPRVAGRTVILVDDGLATGSTMIAAARSLRPANAAHIVLAVPVGSREACDALAEEADEVVCLVRPVPFLAVSAHYERFDATTDEEVQAILRAAWERRG